MAKRPAMQLYLGDLFNNANLKRNKKHRRWVWLEIMGLMHENDEEYGVLRWPLAEIADAVDEPISVLQKLIDTNVLKGTNSPDEKVSFSSTFSRRKLPPIEINLVENQPGPFWFSSRMLREEYLSKKRGAHGHKSSQNNNVPNKKNKEKDTISKPDVDTFSPSPSSSSSSSDLNNKICNTPHNSDPREKKSDELFDEKKIEEITKNALEEKNDLYVFRQILNDVGFRPQQILGNETTAMIQAWINAGVDEDIARTEIVSLNAKLSGLPVPKYYFEAVLRAKKNIDAMNSKAEEIKNAPATTTNGKKVERSDIVTSANYREKVLGIKSNGDTEQQSQPMA